MMSGWGHDWGGGSGALMVIVMIAVVALIVVGVILLVRGLSRHGHGQPGAPQGPPPGAGSSGALQVLEERYARGEIQREEFLQRKQDLLGGQEVGR
jgi:putative membrane protein